MWSKTPEQLVGSDMGPKHREDAFQYLNSGTANSILISGLREIP